MNPVPSKPYTPGKLGKRNGCCEFFRGKCVSWACLVAISQFRNGCTFVNRGIKNQKKIHSSRYFCRAAQKLEKRREQSRQICCENNDNDGHEDDALVLGIFRRWRYFAIHIIIVRGIGNSFSSFATFLLGKLKGSERVGRKLMNEWEWRKARVSFP